MYVPNDAVYVGITGEAARRKSGYFELLAMPGILFMY